ncbi:hypothetical protein GLOTRDRAFT_113658 [Gloeophyllum trabeum ATCC 11539]|uniref:Glycosyltransferase family 32 protein n=1 Tax=Gloeophyllum trabeum (strain ATCC 11539 / FP-39264 / Madison 617) TaxID=670483 RepID=S7QNV6_GLOTA|nr:uncharacterized protein GLOTRDRAFT_113658 [Gloeophyllum trabeum ATCC 11539]EPQ61256.1 hypothetical protein GLOTRDRAFT_113658 [Gloeophyllum trabeum ATCC 11539]
MFAMDLRKTGLALLALGLLLLAFPHLGALSTLLYTYLAFPLKHTHVLGAADGFDLANLTHQASLLSSPSPSSQPYTTPVVPKIIHQVRLGNLTMRPKWQEAHDACTALHPPAAGWEFRVWDDAAADAFVEQHYPQLFATYRGYPYEIQRTNILRYLVLHRFGGIYMDLDLRCIEPLDGLLGVEFLTPPANPTGVNNAFIVARPNHGFLEFVVGKVKKYDLRWGMPYVTNMFSTGCQFWSTMHTLYPHREQLTVLPQEYKLNGHVLTPLFEHLGASSWHRSDARLILLIGKTIESVKSSPVLVVALLFLASSCIFLVLFHRRRRGHGYSYSLLPTRARAGRERGSISGRAVVLVIEEEGESVEMSPSSSAGPSSPRGSGAGRWDVEKGGR